MIESDETSEASVICLDGQAITRKPLHQCVDMVCVISHACFVRFLKVYHRLIVQFSVIFLSLRNIQTRDLLTFSGGIEMK